jgi:hypothetical protein
MTGMTARKSQDEDARTGLKEVDIYADPGIWVCLDEGCNSNCHGTAWAENAINEFKKCNIYGKDVKNLGCDWVHHGSKSSTGKCSSQDIRQSKNADLHEDAKTPDALTRFPGIA